jgi:hypothetical protein
VLVVRPLALGSVPLPAVPANPDVAVVGRRRRRLQLFVVAAASAVALPVLHIGNRLSARRTLAGVRWLSGWPWRRLPVDPPTVGRAVNGVAGRLGLGGTSCLARSELIWLILVLGGLEPVVRIGAGAGLGDGTMAHAWVELDGVPVADPADIAVLHPPFDRPVLVRPA